MERNSGGGKDLVISGFGPWGDDILCHTMRVALQKAEVVGPEPECNVDESVDLADAALLVAGANGRKIYASLCRDADRVHEIAQRHACEQTSRSESKGTGEVRERRIEDAALQLRSQIERLRPGHIAGVQTEDHTEIVTSPVGCAVGYYCEYDSLGVDFDFPDDE